MTDVSCLRGRLCETREGGHCPGHSDLPPQAPRRGHPRRPAEPSSCTTGHTQGLRCVQVSSLQGLRSSCRPGGHPFQKAALAPRKGASRTSPAEQLSPHPLADQLTWQHSFKGAGQACKNEPSKAFLTPTEAPVRSTPRAARPRPLWKRQGTTERPAPCRVHTPQSLGQRWGLPGAPWAVC